MSSSLPRLIAVVLLGGMLGILNSTMVAAGLDTLAAAFDASLSTIGWVSTGFLLAVTATIPVTSWAVDRFGGRRLWLSGLLLFLAGSLGAGLAWDAGSLIAFRVVQGVAAGVLDPLVLTLLARAAGPQRAGRVMGLMGVVLSLGPVLGPMLGGALIQAFSWSWMFLLNVPVGVLAFVLALRVIPADDPSSRSARLDVLGLALLAPGFAALVLALSQYAEQGAFGAWPVLVPLVIGAVLLAGYGAHARRGEPLIDPRLFARRPFTAAVLVMGLVGLATFATLFALPLFFQQAHGVGALASGALVAPVGLGAAVAMPVAGRLSDRLGARGPALGGAAVAVLGGLAFTRFDAGTAWVWPVLAGCAVGLGLGFVGAPTMGSLYRLLPPPLIPQGSAVLYMLNQLGAALGIAVVTLAMQTAADALTGLRTLFWFATAMTIIILAAVPLLPGRPSPAPAAENPVRT